MSVYGGRSYEPQVQALRAGIDVVVGTPGRLLDLARQGHLDLSAVEVLVLDEADEMLDLGFLPDVERILALTPSSRQTMLFSATMPGEIVTLSRKYLNQPTRISAEDPDESRIVPATAQHVFRAHSLDKPEMLSRLLQAEGRGLTMVFTQTKRQADRLAEELATRGFAAAAVHGDLGQGERERALRAFRSGKIDVLVATDVAARGIDVEGVTHVVNYSCPDDEKTYLHRIGRTGRAGASGVAVTLVDWDDVTRWKSINTILGLPFDDPPETYSTSEEFYDELGIPHVVTGTLPKAERLRAGLRAETLEDLGETGRGARSGRQRGGAKSGEGNRGRGGAAQPRSGTGARTGGGRSRNSRAATAPSAVESTTDTAGQAGTAGAAGPAGTAERPPRQRRRTRSRGDAGGDAAATAQPGGASTQARASDAENGSGAQPPQRRRSRQRRSGSRPDAGSPGGTTGGATPGAGSAG